MPLVPVIPESAPFSLEQRAWLNGFLAGLYSRGEVAPQAKAATAPALKPLTILFGSQTGTAESLAKRLAKEAGKRGFAPAVIDMAQYSLERLLQDKNVFVITSTYGDGEPPDNAKTLFAAVSSPTAPRFSDLTFSVCSIGDSNYARFCQCGKDFDHHLERLGGKRCAPRVDCDVDYEQKFVHWMDGVLGSIAGTAIATVSAAPTSSPATQEESAPAIGSRQNPWSAKLLESRLLNGAGSAKEVHHISFSLDGSGLSYEPGDALGVYPWNCHDLVADLLAALNCDGEEAVPAPDGSTTSLRHALTVHYDLGRPTPELLAHYSAQGGGVAVATPHVIDVVMASPHAKLSPTDFVRSLKRLQPRLYSISSSPRAHPNEVHLTVGSVRYELAGRPRKGVCSTFLGDRCTPGESQIPIFIHRNSAFRPPTESGTDVIMVGPGTGIAPFRAFLHHRQALGATGRNWLFFGDQRASTDFLYREEIEAFQRNGVLHQLDTAFSRDQAEKIYVQHRMLERAGELFAWLERGAHFYVCGDASRMAKDVHTALQKVIESAGKMSSDSAAEYLQALQTAKRYQRDVY